MIYISAILVLNYVLLFLGQQIDASLISSESSPTNEVSVNLGDLSLFSNKSSETKSLIQKFDDNRNQKNKKKHKHRHKQGKAKKIKEEKIKLRKSKTGRRHRKKTKKHLRSKSKATTLERSTKIPTQESTFLSGLSETMTIGGSNNTQLKFTDSLFTNESIQNIDKKTVTPSNTKEPKVTEIDSLTTAVPIRSETTQNNTTINSSTISESKQTLNESTLENLENTSINARKNNQGRESTKQYQEIQKSEKLKEVLDEKKGKVEENKFQNITTENFEQQSDYSNLSKVVSSITPDLSNPDKEKNNKLAQVLMKTIEKNIYRLRSSDTSSISTEFMTQAKNDNAMQTIYSAFPIPTFAAIDSRLKYITVQTKLIKFKNNYTTKFEGLRMFSGPYTVTTTSVPRGTDMPPPSDEDYTDDTENNKSEFIESNNKIYLIDKKNVAPNSKVLTENTDIEQIFGKVIDDILKDGGNISEELKENQVKLNNKEIDNLFETEIRRERAFKNFKSGDTKTSNETFSDTENASNETSTITLLKRFSVVTNKNTEKRKDNTTTKKAMTTKSVSFLATVMRDGEIRDKIETSTDETDKHAPKWKIFHYVSSYSDEEDLIKKNIYRALDTVKKKLMISS